MKRYILKSLTAAGLVLSLGACSDGTQFKEAGVPTGGTSDAADPTKNPDGTTKTGTESPDSMDPNAAGKPGGEPGMDPLLDENGNPIDGGNPTTVDPSTGGGGTGPVSAQPGTDPNGSNPGNNPGNNPGTTPNKETAAQKLRETCEKGTKKTIKQSVFFPERKGCGFGANGNLDKKDAFLQASEAQAASLSLPAKAQLCGLEIGSQATTIQYDDFMILTLNNYVLLSSNTALLNGLQDGNNGAMVWDFNAVKGVPVDFNSPQYCLGAASSICQVPVTDTPGQFQFQIDPNSLEMLADKIVDQRVLTFGLISTGDNDDKDCWHTEFTLDFTLNYVE